MAKWIDAVHKLKASQKKRIGAELVAVARFLHRERGPAAERAVVQLCYLAGHTMEFDAPRTAPKAKATPSKSKK